MKVSMKRMIQVLRTMLSTPIYTLTHFIIGFTLVVLIVMFSTEAAKSIGLRKGCEYYAVSTEEIEVCYSRAMDVTPQYGSL